MTSTIPTLISIGRRMYDRGYISATDGNLSFRLEKNKIAITCSGVCKGDLTSADISICSPTGELIEGKALSSETPMHLMAYSKRADIQAVIHAHPPSVLALSLCGKIIHNHLPEVIMGLGEIGYANFAVPSTNESAEAIAGLIDNHNAIVLDRHGSITVGKTLWDAFWKLERLEFAAMVTLQALQIGTMKKLTKSQISRIVASARNYEKIGR